MPQACRPGSRSPCRTARSPARPTTAGTTNFTVSVADSASQQISAGFSLTIDPPIVSAGTVTVNPTSIQIGQTTVGHGEHHRARWLSPRLRAQCSSSRTEPISARLFPYPTPRPLSQPAPSPTPAALPSQPCTSGDVNYQTESYPPAMLAVGVAPAPAIAVTPSAVAIAQGEAATLTATVLNFGSGSVTLSCGTLPANVHCTFSPLSASARQRSPSKRRLHPPCFRCPRIPATGRAAWFWLLSFQDCWLCGEAAERNISGQSAFCPCCFCS